jgi:hypothetical protein
MTTARSVRLNVRCLGLVPVAIGCQNLAILAHSSRFHVIEPQNLEHAEHPCGIGFS